MKGEAVVSGREERAPEGALAQGKQNTLDVAVVGAGTMARHHVRAIARAEGARVVAVAEPRAETRRQMLELCEEAKGYPSLTALLEERTVNVVHVCTPPSTHVPLAREALEAGIHVYVEKPFAPTAEEARELLTLAAARGLHVCAGHQLLYETPSRKARELLPALGTLVHLESYFSFRQVRTGQDGKPALPAELQLLDILPHPVYLLLAFLEEAAPGGETSLERVHVGRAGTIHALVRLGDLTGTLVVTLGGRPVESYLRLVGTTGSLHADYVRGTVQRSIGQGTSGIDKALQPYRLARQLVGGTTAALGRRILRRQKTYPGLLEIFKTFYGSICGIGPPPLTPESIQETVRICKVIGQALRQKEDKDNYNSKQPPPGPRVLVTGGTGFLGREVALALHLRGATPVVVARHQPPVWERLPGVKYVTADLAEGLCPKVLEGSHVIVHCAAETRGGWEAHERNSVRATEKLVRAAAEAGVRRLVHVSSIAVLEGRERLNEKSPLTSGNRSGPYVWGKAESERRVRQLGDELDIQVRIVRPGAIIDYRAFEPPGKLGRRLGNLFFAVGGSRDTLGLVEIQEAAQCITWMALRFEQSPYLLNLIDADLPTKRDLVHRLRQSNPELRVVWLPHQLIQLLSWGLILLQKLLRPSQPPINLAKVFTTNNYDTTLSRLVRQRMSELRRYSPDT